MKVSIVMCTYNVSPYIDRAIQSIIAQTYTDWELIISDNCSTDNTRDIIQGYLADKRISLYVQAQNLGYIRNKNSALRKATGELVTFQDADDTCNVKRLEQQVNVFLSDQSITICGTNFTTIDLQDNILNCQKYDNDYLVTEIMDDYPFWFSGLMFKHELLNEFGYFPEYFADIYGDDYYWTMRVNKKYPVYFIKDALYNYRLNPSSVTYVLDNTRKMIVPDILFELFSQRSAMGTDWLEQGDISKLTAFEQKVLTNKTLMAERYRQWAAKSIDKGNWGQAWSLIKKYLSDGELNVNGIKTLVYYIRKRYFFT